MQGELALPFPTWSYIVPHPLAMEQDVTTGLLHAVPPRGEWWRKSDGLVGDDELERCGVSEENEVLDEKGSLSSRSCQTGNSPSTHPVFLRG